ncbi:MAG: hypothetical protein RJA81_442 [Planctomycetota bacterium]|jgi:hypothetical protein
MSGQTLETPELNMNLPETLTSLHIDSKQSALNFYSESDRLGHRFHFADSQTVIASVNAPQGWNQTEGFPPSPIFQEIHEEELPTGKAIMLVGQWLKIHYSAVCLSPHDGLVDLQIAARVRSPEATQLASTYAVNLTASDLIHADQTEIRLKIGKDRLVRICAGKESQLMLTPVGLNGLQFQVLPIKPDSGSSESGSLSRTIQWSYTFELVRTENFV